ncbi:MAG: hypothetical protein P4M02_11755, partial [Clostridia bacterium]|nr:hypothetical protein [Clostridia bacterium]
MKLQQELLLKPAPVIFITILLRRNRDVLPRFSSRPKVAWQIRATPYGVKGQNSRLKDLSFKL